MPALPVVPAESLDLDPQRLDRLFDTLTEWTSGESPEIPSAGVIIGRQGRTIEPRFFGRQSPDNDAPIRTDGAFLLASITKPFTYLAALQLVEQGLLNLTDPVTRYLPEFAANGKEAVRVHHLFTHTSGLPDMLPNNQQLRAAHAPLSQFIEQAIQKTSLAFTPGTSQQYQSMGTLIVAELVHQLSGKLIDQYLSDHIFQPLGMQSSSLGSGGIDEDRIVGVEIPSGASDTDYHWNSSYWRQFGAPWGGMFSTPSDLAVFCNALLRGGAHQGNRVWAPTTLASATTNRMNDYPDLPEPIRRTKRWGLGWQMNAVGTNSVFCDLLDGDVFGHTGATGTMLWIDRRRDLFCILLTTAIRSKAPWRLVRLSNMAAAAIRQ